MKTFPHPQEDKRIKPSGLKAASLKDLKLGTEFVYCSQRGDTNFARLGLYDKLQLDWFRERMKMECLFVEIEEKNDRKNKM